MLLEFRECLSSVKQYFATWKKNVPGFVYLSFILFSLCREIYLLSGIHISNGSAPTVQFSRNLHPSAVTGEHLDQNGKILAVFFFLLIWLALTHGFEVHICIRSWENWLKMVLYSGTQRMILVTLWTLIHEYKHYSLLNGG